MTSSHVLTLDPDVVWEAERFAAADGVTVEDYVNNVLSRYMMQERARRRALRVLDPRDV